MTKFFPALLLFCALTFPAFAQNAPTLESLNREVGQLLDDLRDLKKENDDLRDRVRTLEDRLGRTMPGANTFKGMDERLYDLERDVSRLK